METADKSIKSEGGGCGGVFKLDESFMIDTNLINHTTMTSELYRLAALDAYRKYRNNYKISNIRLSTNGVKSTVLYSFVTSDVKILEMHDRLNRSKPSVNLPTERFKARIAASSSSTSTTAEGADPQPRSRFDKLCMTYKHPNSGKTYFHTHTGKVYDNHFALGSCPVREPENIKTVNIECDHVFKTIEHQTRSGDEEITVINICVKCNSDKKNLRKIPKIISSDKMEIVTRLLNLLTDREFDYKESQTLAHLFSLLNDD